ncbi:hypothetical protein SAMN05880557_10790 [Pseudacidovorax sp. RU35E]|nr:hypothetical protein SAMN05880557_10790 [Pseudacidovorax sp. RU35E]
MDTRPPERRSPAQVEQLKTEIKERMPEVYAAIQQKARVVGKQAFAWVTLGLRGEPNCFYAIERGRVVGTPFDQAVMADVAVAMVQFGCSFVCIWPDAQKGSDGAA